MTDPITEATAPARLSAALGKLLDRPDWRPTRAHVETARNEIAALTARAEQAKRELDAANNAIRAMATQLADTGRERDRLRDGLDAAIRAAKLALFVINKHGVMPNSSWEGGFAGDLATAEAARGDEQKADTEGQNVGSKSSSC